MNATQEDLIKYRLLRAKDTFEDAQILADRQKWNSTVNYLPGGRKAITMIYLILTRRKYCHTLSQYKN